jgi:hypothetical protein
MLKSFRIVALLGVVFLAGCAGKFWDDIYKAGSDFDSDDKRMWERASEYELSSGVKILIPPQSSLFTRPIAVEYNSRYELNGKVKYQFENISEAQQAINLDKENRQRELDEKRAADKAAEDKRAAADKRAKQVKANWKRKHYDTRSIRNPLIIGHGDDGAIAFDIGNDDFRGLKAKVTCYDAFDTSTVREVYSISKSSVTPTIRNPFIHAGIGDEATYNGKYIGGPMGSVFYQLKLQELATQPSTDRCVMKTLDFRQ